MSYLTKALVLASLALGCASASAQIAGDAVRGNTPPGTSQDGSRPADGAIKGGSILPGERSGLPEKDVVTADERKSRCYELTDSLREDCLKQERSAVGGTRAPRDSEKPPLIEKR